MRKTGIAFVVVAWAILLYTALGAPFFAHAHSHMDSFAQPWPVALGTILPGVGIVLTMVPLRRRERWSFWTLLLTFAALLVGRFLSDPRCMVVLDPHQHGCHTFMIAIVLGIVGVIMAR